MNLGLTTPVVSLKWQISVTESVQTKFDPFCEILKTLAGFIWL
jgi:hypothetical protein